MSAAAIIEELLEYFEDRADASMEPGEDRFHGNKEMSLLQEVQKLEKYISEASRWIPVTERLPENAEHVLIATKTWEDAHDAIRCGGHWMNLSMQVDHEDAEGEVTHWHPKPVNPNVEAK